MSTEYKRELLFRKQRGRQHLAAYLKELEAVFNVHSDDVTILSLEETDAIVELSSKKTDKKVRSKQTVPFDEKENLLKQCIDNYSQPQPNKIYVFTDYSKECGGAVLDSFAKLNTNFAFNAEHGGLISILSEDLSNKLILDFYEDNNKPFLEIEALGGSWGGLFVS